MSFVPSGIKELYIAPGNADFPAALTTVLGMGIRNTGNLMITPFNEITDHNGRKFPIMMNFKAEMPTFQLDSATMLGLLIANAKLSSSAVAIVTAGATEGTLLVTSPTGGVFLFDGASPNNCMGIDFEILLSLKERAVKLTLERAFLQASGITLLTNAATESIPFATDKLPMITPAEMVTGFVSPANTTNLLPSFTDTSAFSDIRIVDFSCSIKTKGVKNGFNVSLVRGLEVTLSVIAQGPDALTIKEGLANALVTSDITVDLGTNNIILKKDGLSRLGSVEIGDEKREIKLDFSGTYDIDFATFAGANLTLNTYLQASA